MRARTLPLALAALASYGVACGQSPASAPAGRLAIATAPLHLTSIVDAEYDLAVYNGLGALVWKQNGLRSRAFGDGRGALAYVGPCDASPGASFNRVELSLVAIWDGPDRVPANAWSNPTDGGPLVRTVECVENADVAVTFDLTIVRAAGQGFFDVGVTFSDIFCSAKVDCKDAFLHDGLGARAPTVLVTFACTSGEGAPTWLHYSDVALKCGDTTTWLDPSVGPGQVGGHPPTLFQVATYRGQEAFEDLDKCYWNVALGLNLGPSTRGCSLVAYATASDADFDTTGATPEGTVYPYIAFELPLTDPESGAFVCGQHPLGGTPAGVSIGYTDTLGTRFVHAWQCSDTADIEPRGITCDGLAVGTNETATFTQSPGGVTFAVDGRASPLIKLPPNRRLAGCCANPCPGCAASP